MKSILLYARFNNNYLLQIPEIDCQSSEGISLTNPKGEIEFKDVRFRYPTRSEEEVLKGISFKVLIVMQNWTSMKFEISCSEEIKVRGVIGQIGKKRQN